MARGYMLEKLKSEAKIIGEGMADFVVRGTAIFRREDQHKLQPPAEDVTYQVKFLFHEPEITVRCLFHE